VLEFEVLAVRVDQYQPALLDLLIGAGEVMWVGVEPLGERDGRIALYLTDHARRLRRPADTHPSAAGRAVEVLQYLRAHGASFFNAVHEGTGCGFPQEIVDALWQLVWAGLVTNDTLHALRAYVRADEPRARRRGRPTAFRSRRLVPPTAEGRWSSVESPKATKTAATEWAAATARQLLSRHGIVTRETVASDAVAGGFSAVYDVLKAMEHAGRVRRGYFVAGLGGAQFAMPPALDLLRSLRDPPEDAHTSVLAATDPANPYGSILKWPDAACGATRTVGSLVILVDGFAAAYLRRGERELLVFAPDTEPQRSRMVRSAARMLMHLAASKEEGRRGMLIADINGEAAPGHATAGIFVEEGFAATAMGLQARVQARRFGPDPESRRSGSEEL
jgi:ATP-dependent Lhr-like helicase